MNYLDDKDYEDVSFIKKHPESAGRRKTVKLKKSENLVLARL